MPPRPKPKAKAQPPKLKTPDLGGASSASPTSSPGNHTGHKLTALASLKPNPRNPNTHPDSQIALLAKIIAHQGWRAPIVVSERSGLIVAGHARLEAARRLGLAQAPVNHQPFATDEDELAHLLADNKIAELADLNLDDVKTILGELDLEMRELAGFDATELEQIFADAFNELDAEPQLDKAEELQKQWQVKPGQLWALGEHRLLCGDSTKEDDVQRLLGDEKPLLMVTDPPYGVEYDANWRNEADISNGNKSGGRAVGKVENDHQADWTPAWKLFPGDAAYIWHADRHASEVQSSLECAKFKIRCQIIWAKSRFVIGRGDYHWQHEPCWYAVREGGKGHWAGDRSQTTLWKIDKPQKSETGHSTQKPVECMQRPIVNNSRRGDLVYEPFSGSGTTIIAAERTGRRCYAIEISPKYVAVALQRYLDATQKKPTLL